MSFVCTKINLNNRIKIIMLFSDYLLILYIWINQDLDCKLVLLLVELC